MNSRGFSDAGQEWPWKRLALIASGVAVLAVAAWLFRHPLPAEWDETNYMNVVTLDVAVLQSDGLVAMPKRLAVNHRTKPPGYRLLGIPITHVFGFSPTLLRSTSTLASAAAVVFVGMTARLIAGSAAGWFAVLCYVTSPLLLINARLFRTEGLIALAAAATLYGVVCLVATDSSSQRAMAFLAAAVTFGALAKQTYPFFIAPLLLGFLLLAYVGRLSATWRTSATWALSVAALIAPLYVLNLRTYWGYATYAGFDYDSTAIHADNPLTHYLIGVEEVVGLLFGVPGFLLAITGIVMVVWHRRIDTSALSDKQRNALVLLAWSYLPMAFFGFLLVKKGPSWLGTLLPGLIVLAAVLARISSATSSPWVRRIGIAVAAYALLVYGLPTLRPDLQAGIRLHDLPAVVAQPLRVTAPMPQVDWERLYTLVGECSARPLKVAGWNLAYARKVVRRPLLEHPWIRRGRRGVVDFTQLESKTPDLSDYDVIVVARDAFPEGHPPGGNVILPGGLADRYSGPIKIEPSSPLTSATIEVFLAKSTCGSA